MLGYFCGYYRYHYPLQYITSFLNNAANEEDIRNGTEYASKCGIQVTMPKWGISKSEYYFDEERNMISKGVSSIKYMSPLLAEQMYDLSKKRKYVYFTDLLADLDKETCMNTRQLDILIKLDFFSDFGNQRELIRITDVFYNTFKGGTAKQIKKETVDGTPLGDIIARHAIGTTKNGGVAKSYALVDMDEILHETETAIKQANISDLDDTLKVQNFYDAMGYAGYTSGKEEDRRKLYVLDVYPVVRKKDGKQFGYSVRTKSIGSGKESRFTVLNALYNKDPIINGQIVYCEKFERDGAFFRLTGYSIMS